MAQKTRKHTQNALLTPLTVFSPLSPDELQLAVNDLSEVPSEGNRPTRLHGPIGKWDVSQLTDMSNIFYDRRTFDYDISNWDVSRVTDMHGMFSYALHFNQDLSKWDVFRVTDMDAMFSFAHMFNQDLSQWDVSRVFDMQWMFEGANSFNQTLCGAAWVNSKATKVDMFTGSLGSISDTVCGVWTLWLYLFYSCCF